jgi:SAM-dependent methyltransferase
MIRTNCYLCGALPPTTLKSTLLIQKHADPILELISEGLSKTNRRIIKCPSCGFVYRDPTLENSEIEILYTRYRDQRFRRESPDEYFDRITSIPDDQSQNFSKTTRIDFLFKTYATQESKPVLRLLDVGTGGGVFIHTFLRNSIYHWSAYGVEPTSSYASLAERRLGIPIVNSFYKPNLFNLKFDLITVNKVLEHTADPILFLQGLKQDLAPDGLIYLEVPSASEVLSLPVDHPQLTYDHLIFFSIETLSKIATIANLRVLFCDETSSPSGEADVIVALGH